MSLNYQELRNFTLGHFKEKLADGDLAKPIEQLAIDSLDLFEYVMALEQKFNLRIETDAADTAMSLDQFCRRITEGK